MAVLGVGKNTKHGHKYNIKWNDFQQGYRCSHCYGNYRKSTEEISKHLESEGYKLLSEYKGALSKILLQCPKNHQFYMNWNSFQQGQRCPRCCNYKSEKKLGEMLEQIFPNKVQRQDSLGFLGRQRVDFSIRGFQLAFEYDGEHHFRPVQYGGMKLRQAKKNLITQQERDNRKDSLCQENGYKLIRIAYNEKLSLENVEAKIKSASTTH